MLVNIASAYRRFHLELSNFAAFPPRVIFVDVIPDENLEALKNELEDALLKAGYPIKKEQRSFHPHVTIANRDLKKEDFPKAWNYFKTIQYHERFTAEAITLLKHNGQRWITLFNATLP